MIDLLFYTIKAVICLAGIFIVGLLFVVALIPDDVEEIDNSDGSIICSYTDNSCIKSKLYTKCNCCSDCPIYEERNKYE